MKNNTKLFMQIVQIDSVTGEETEMSNFLMQFLTHECDLHPIRDKHNNVFVQTKGTGEPVFMSAHMDTVEPGKGIIPKLKDGVITSSGNTILGADNKAAVSVLLSTLLHIRKNPNKNWRPLDILFTTSEEVGNYGAIGFDTSNIRAKIGYTFDGTGPVGTIMSASPYYARFNVIIRGVAAHAGYPNKATPAVPVLLELLQNLEQLRSKDLLINVGKIKGGTARNTIIGKLAFKGEIRSFYSTVFQETMKKMHTIFSKKYSCKIEFEIVVENPGYFFSKADYSSSKKTIEKSLGRKIQVKQSYGVSDANIFNQNLQKLKVFNLADGSRGSHTTHESISVSALETMCDLVLKLAKSEGEK